MTPFERSQSWWSSEASPTTFAPFTFSSWTVIVPTPPAAAETTTVSPSLMSTARTAAKAVTPTT